MSLIEPAFAFYLVLGSLNAEFQWIVVFYYSVRRKKKVVLFPENWQGENVFIVDPHAWSNVYQNVYFCLNKQTNKKKKEKNKRQKKLKKERD